MSKNVTRFPITGWRRAANRRGRHSVSCIVSDRWLRFAPKAKVVGEGTAVIVDVLTDASGNDRKICQLILTLEQLRRVMDSIPVEE
jgi:hypothetical protein